MATKKLTPAGPATKGLKVVSRSDSGFRRCGISFPAEGMTVALSELSQEQVDTLKTEPQLVVVEVDIAAS